MDEDERHEYEADAREYGIPAMLDRMGMDGLGNEVVSLHKRIAELEAHVEHDEGNLGGLQHALVRANQQYTQAEIARNALFEQFRHVSKVALEQQRRAAKAEAALAERDKMLHRIELAGDRMERGIGLYFGKDQLDPMNDARMAWHTLRARAEEGT